MMNETIFHDTRVREFLDDGESPAYVRYNVVGVKYGDKVSVGGGITIFDGNEQACFSLHAFDRTDFEKRILELENLQTHINRFVTQLKLASETLPERVARDD